LNAGEHLGIDPAQRTLVRVMRTVFPNEARCRWAIHDALRSARRTELPRDTPELLQFVRTHLVPRLSGVIAPSVMLFLLDELASELDPQGVARHNGGPPTPATTPEPIASVPFPKLRRSFAKLARTASTKLSAVRAPSPETKGPASGVVSRRGSLVLVDSDRLTRASLARALVNAKFDVSVVDGPSQISDALKGQAHRTLVVMRVGQHDGGTLRALAAAHPDLPLVAWTSVPPSTAERLLSVAGVARSIVISQTATYLEIIDGIRTFLAELDRPVARFRTTRPGSGTATE
jgi:hypothetical protein